MHTDPTTMVPVDVKATLWLEVVAGSEPPQKYLFPGRAVAATGPFLLALFLLLIGLARSAEGSFAASATAALVNGFVVDIIVTQGGGGYSYTPLVRIVGGGGSGAEARAELDGGSVKRIIVLDAGRGYTSAPTILIDPPQTPFISGIRMVPELTIEAVIGSDVQIQATEDLRNAASWRVLDTRKLTEVPFVFVDRTPQTARRFYRVINLSLYSPTSDLTLFVPIPPGSFLMGSPPGEVDAVSDERPQTLVNITRGFWISKYEVTRAQYQEVTGLSPGPPTDNRNRPVENVSWNDAVAYCAQLTDRMRTAGLLPTGFVFRLPTQAEWEYACRAGTTTAYSFGDDPAAIDSYAWNANNADLVVHSVGQKLPNPWGLFDMHGNAQEMCHDFNGPYPGGEVTDYHGPATGTFRVRRGGSVGTGVGACRSAGRMQSTHNDPRPFVGFRVALAQPIQN